jgi:hypothetical protein
MEPMAQADPGERSANGRGRAWPANFWAVAFVLAVAGLAIMTTLEQLQQRRWEQERAAYDEAHAYRKIVARLARANDIEQPAAAAADGKAGRPAPETGDGTARTLAEAAGGVLILVLTVALIRRSRPTRVRLIEAREKWASTPALRAETGATLHPAPQRPSGSIAAERLSAVVWSDHLIRQQDVRKSA